MKSKKMKLNVLIILCIIYLGCGSQESIISENSYSKVEQYIIKEPKKYLDRELNSLLLDFKEDYEEYTYDLARIFMLSGLNFKFKDEVVVNVKFNWENSDFNYEGNINDKNHEWDFEKLKKEKIRSIMIYKSDKVIYTTG